jgi:hypothetical protein
MVLKLRKLLSVKPDLGQKNRVCTDFDPTIIVSSGIGLYKTSTHACERVQHPVLALAIVGQILCQAVVYKLGRKTGNPRNPAMNRKLLVFCKGRVPEPIAIARS